METKSLESVLLKEKETRKNKLILHNDDYNTFDYVILSLVEVCRHDSIRAEHCAILVHYNGECCVDSGSFEEMETKKEILIDRGLSATIE
jgi:ATP-dependent Clp protease adaptor protein ClpS